ncbi:MAG: amidohydrolase family protein [Deltaproteobacteria bacterium]|nr:amidohydrolase family protein [Deltaproteobacteria bacterium]
MIVDVHYHNIINMSEKAARANLPLMIHIAQEMGVEADPESLVKTAMETWGNPTGEKLIETMDVGGIDVTVAVSADDYSNPVYTIEGVKRSNRLLSEAAQRFSRRIVPLAALDPRRPEAVELANLYLGDYGMRGFKYHPDNGYDPSGPESYKVLEVLAKHQGILLTHTSPLSPPSRSKYSEPMLLADMGVDFPEITVIAAHMGGYINWRPWAALASVQPSLYGDLAMWDTLAYHQYDLFCRELRTIIDFVGADKILFGSDAPIHTIVRPIKDWVQTIRELPEKAPAGIYFTKEEIDLILGGNAAKILKLDH